MFDRVREVIRRVGKHGFGSPRRVQKHDEPVHDIPMMGKQAEERPFPPYLIGLRLLI